MSARILSTSFFFVLIFCISTFAQTTEFTYQGRLVDNGLPANTLHDFEFRLFAAESGGTPVGGLVEARSGVQVTNGIFTVKLNFGTQFDGSPRWLEISVKPTSGSTFALLSPRQPISSAPYSIKSLNASTADLAINSTQLGGVDANQYVVTNDTRLSDARTPTAGSGDYIQNTTATQPTSNFNISGNGFVAGSLGVGTLAPNPDAKFEVSGSGFVRARVNSDFNGGFALALNNQPKWSIATAGSGQFQIFNDAIFQNAVWIDPTNNNFGIGTIAPGAKLDVSGNGIVRARVNSDSNSGLVVSLNNQPGWSLATTTGNQFQIFNEMTLSNAVWIDPTSNNFGIGTTAPGSKLDVAGAVNTSTQFNIGGNRILSNPGVRNLFVGEGAGAANTSADNTFVGWQAGIANTTAGSNSFFGMAAGTNTTTGGANSFFGRAAGAANTTGNANAFFGFQAGVQNNLGIQNSFFGASAGQANNGGSFNAFFGFAAGGSNKNGFNSFFGWSSGNSNTDGFDNAFFGMGSGQQNTTSSRNAFFGSRAGNQNTTGELNSFFGYLSGFENSTGASNSFFGKESGRFNNGSFNTFVGENTGAGNTSGSNNTLLGRSANVTNSALNFATAIGSNSTVGTNDTIVLGKVAGTYDGVARPADSVQVPGDLTVTGAINGTVLNATNAVNATNATTAQNVSGIVAIENGGTGSSTKAFVDLSTNQIIVGNKNFQQTATFSGVNITSLTNNGSATFNGQATFNNADPVTINGVLNVGGAVNAEQFGGSGEGLTNLPGSGLVDGSVTRPKLAYGATSKYDAQLVAILRWDLLVQKTFTLAPAIHRAAFDGANIWVTDGNGTNVTKLRANDGVNLGTFPVGSGPFHHVAFDGANIWVTNRGGNNVTKLRASDGANQGTFAVGTGPLGVAFDGANVWIANFDSDNLTKLRASDGVNLGTFAVADPRAMAFDGTDIWVACSGGQVRRVRTTDGTVLNTYPIINSGEILSDGIDMWVNRGDGQVAKFRRSDGSIVGTFPIGGFADGFGFDGTHIWVASNSGFVRKLRASDGGVLGTFPVASPGTGVTGGVLFDGTHIWVLLSNGIAGGALTRIAVAQ